MFLLPDIPQRNLVTIGNLKEAGSVKAAEFKETDRIHSLEGGSRKDMSSF